MTPETFCRDKECPVAPLCGRFITERGVWWVFTESPRKGDRCDMFWGRDQQNIMDKLESVVKGEER